MKQLKYLFVSLAALCMAACTQDDDFLPDGGTDTTGGDLQEYTLTVGIDYGMEGDDRERFTRAISDTDDAPTRCLMQVYDGNTAVDAVQRGEADGNNYTFTVSLVAGRTYNFCFWADNGEAEITSLKAVPYTIGTVAFAATVECQVNQMKGVKLKHVVTKVTLATTAATTIAEGKEATLATQCATEYNALLGTVTAFGTQTYTASASGSYDANADVVSCYVIPTTEKQGITIGCHLLTQTIPDVPLAPNTHVTLRGDLSEESENWRATDEYKLKLILSALFDENGNPQGNFRGDFEYYFYGSKDELNAFCQRLTRNPNFEVSNDNNQFILGNNYGDNPCVYVRYFDVGYEGVITYMDDSNYYEFIVSANKDYPAFPVID